MKPRFPIPMLVRTACAIVLLAGCAPKVDHHDDATSVAVPHSPAPDPAAQARADGIAQDVAAKAKRGERAEGRQNLVKDEVRVKNDGGVPVVEQRGEASWYGRYHHGRKTANGERFDQNDLTAAHPTLPLGTEARVTNLDNGKSVTVIINDRGPYAKGRDIDLSRAAAQRLGLLKDGAVAVQIDAVVTPAPARTAGR